MSRKFSISNNPSAANRRKSVFTPNLSTSSSNETLVQANELERLEQEITLTLQSIDKSFAKSHKIINDKLTPIVKKYHQNSKQIWTGVNFWKTFLEASANVELRGYEEAVQNEADLDDANQGEFDQDMTDSNEQMSPVKINASSAGNYHDDVLQESTNHIAQQFQHRYNVNFNDKDKRLLDNPIMPEVHRNNVGFDTTDSIVPPIPVTANLSNTNGTDVNQTTPTLQRTATETADYLMHNNLDTNYKVQVSPRKSNKRVEGAVNSITPRKQPKAKKRKSFYAEKFDSSPFEIETPKLNSDVQFSPVKPKQMTPLRKNQAEQLIDDSDLHQEVTQTQRFPLTPRYGAGGNLLHTPGQVASTARRYSGTVYRGQGAPAVNTIADDSEEVPNISPPVTLNFASAKDKQRLSKTPAREAAQNIVKDLLNNVSGINDSGLSEDLPRTTTNFANDTTDDSLFREVPKQLHDTMPQEDLDAFLDRPAPPEKDDDWSE